MKPRMTIKVRVSDLKERPLTDTMLVFLQANKKYAYTRKGLMVEVLKVPCEDIDNKNFGEWKKGQPTMYSRVSKALDTLVKQKQVQSKPFGRKNGKVFYAN